ncbi:hypothetical protein Slala03_79180 [Streptomyces lavendulae subsp. lavendulae]|nr:hypothetical protein Slala03_79180 [Streptomyces lavendulae subsp. lavendulae]
MGRQGETEPVSDARDPSVLTAVNRGHPRERGEQVLTEQGLYPGVMLPSPTSIDSGILVISVNRDANVGLMAQDEAVGAQSAPLPAVSLGHGLCWWVAHTLSRDGPAACMLWCSTRVHRRHRLS